MTTATPTIYRATRPPKHNTNLGLAFVPIWHEPDDSYPSIATRRKSPAENVFIKLSWILEGQDREGGFVIALRKLYKTVAFPDAAMIRVFDTPQLAGESVRIPKQLIGLPDYGARTLLRDNETYEYITATAVEQPQKRRFRTRQIIFNDFQKLSDAQGPRQLCMALRDAMCGLLNAFRMGYVHREITPDIIYIIKDRRAHTMGYMLSRDGMSVEDTARNYSGFLYDFTVCQRIDGTDDQYTGDSEIFEHCISTPTSLLSIEDRTGIVHTPIYDLDSFLWVLLSVTTKIITDYVAGRRKIDLDCPMSVGEEAMNEDSSATLPPKEPATSDRSAFKSSTETKKSVPSSETVAEKDSAGAPSGGIAIDGLEDKTSEETKTTALEGISATLIEPQPAGHTDVAMDIDDDKAHIEQGVVHDEDVIKMDEDGAAPHLEDEEERKRKGSNEKEHEMSKKAKGKQKATEETDEEEVHSAGITPPVDEAMWDADNSDILYYDDSIEGMTFLVSRPLESKPPAGFEPPQKPQYVAFAEDKSSIIINTLLNPRAVSYADRPTREHLLSKLDEFLADSADLAPFRPLVTELCALGDAYRARYPSLQTVFSKDEVEEAFARYLDAFEKNMPPQDNWLYLKWYEGSDMLLKFDEDKFLGAFASTMTPSPSTDYHTLLF